MGQRTSICSDPAMVQGAAQSMDPATDMPLHYNGMRIGWVHRVLEVKCQ